MEKIFESINLEYLNRNFWNEDDEINKIRNARKLSVLLYLIARESLQPTNIHSGILYKYFCDLKQKIYDEEAIQEKIDLSPRKDKIRVSDSEDHLFKLDFADEVAKNSFNNYGNRYVHEAKLKNKIIRLFLKFNGENPNRINIILDVDGIEIAKNIASELNLKIDLSKYLNDFSLIDKEEYSELNLKEYIEASLELERENNEMYNYEDDSETEVIITSKARKIQGKVRQKALEHYVKGEFVEIKNKDSLIASHIKSWKNSNNIERGDLDNIILLDRITDVLFDRGLITFDNNGSIVYSYELEKDLKKDLELKNFLSKGKKIKLNEKRKEYLKYHRFFTFKDGYV